MVALFLLSQVFLIISHGPLAHTLAAIILKSNLDIIENGAGKLLEEYSTVIIVENVAFTQPKESLEQSLESLNEATASETELPAANATERSLESESAEDRGSNEPSTSSRSGAATRPASLDVKTPSETLNKIKNLNVTDEEKEQRLALESPLAPQQSLSDVQESMANKPFLAAILDSLSCVENDYAALFSLCLLYALANNKVLHKKSVRLGKATI